MAVEAATRGRSTTRGRGSGAPARATRPQGHLESRPSEAPGGVQSRPVVVSWCFRDPSELVMFEISSLRGRQSWQEVFRKVFNTVMNGDDAVIHCMA